METSTFKVLLAAFIIVGLFVTLFLQGAYVRYKLLDIERARLSTPGDDVQCPELDNGVRTYALIVTCCKTRELNSGLRMPKAITSAHGYDALGAVTDVSNSARWLALKKTTAALQLQSDVSAGRVKYVVVNGSVLRVASPALNEYFTDGELVGIKASRVLLAVASPFPSGARVTLPWSASALALTSGPGYVDGVLADLCGQSSAACTDDVMMHVWGYSATSSAVGTADDA